MAVNFVPKQMNEALFGVYHNASNYNYLDVGYMDRPCHRRGRQILRLVGQMKYNKNDDLPDRRRTGPCLGYPLQHYHLFQYYRNMTSSSAVSLSKRCENSLLPTYREDRDRICQDRKLGCPLRCTMCSSGSDQPSPAHRSPSSVPSYRQSDQGACEENVPRYRCSCHRYQKHRSLDFS